MIISSVDNKKVKEIRKLRINKHMLEEKRFIVEGTHLVNEAKNANILLEVIKLESCVTNYNVSETIVTKNVMDSISILPSSTSVIGICKFIEEEKTIGSKILLLDDIQDPGNLGTLIRSSKAFNISTIVLGNNCVNKYNEKVIRSSQGLMFNVNIINRNLIDFINKIKLDGFKIYSTNVVNGIDLKDVKVNNKYALILGNEGTGVSSKIDELADERIYIKMSKNCESLNVSVAGSIILYELSKVV